MISLIICSIRPELVISLKANLDSTIGVEYEMIAIDNRGTGKGICQVYNEGARNAKYPYLCFLHEDIAFKSINWGTKVIEAFKADPRLGLIGVAGSTYKSAMPTGWTFPWADEKTRRVNLFQHYKSKNHTERLEINPGKEHLSHVATIDGVWFCTTKSIVEEMPFDEINFKKFHCYDLDFSMSVGTRYNVAVTFEVLLEHFSDGSYDKSWIEETVKWHMKWNKFLPLNLAGYNNNQICQEEKIAFQWFLMMMADLRYFDTNMFNLVWKPKIRSVFGVKEFAKLNFHLISCMINNSLKGVNK